MHDSDLSDAARDVASSMRVAAQRRSAFDGHPLPMRGEWFACTQPERPPDAGTAYWGPCRACRLALAAALHNEPTSVLTVGSDCAEDGVPHHNAPLGEVVAAMALRFDDPLLARELESARTHCMATDVCR